MAESKTVDHGSTTSIDLKLNNHHSSSDYDCSSFSKLLKNVMLGNPPSLAFQGGLGDGKLKETGAQWGLEGQSEWSIAALDSTPGTLKPFSMIQQVVPRLVLKQKNSDHDSSDLPRVGRETPNSDGYQWRKYGQKQMRSSHTSRGYYKCAHVGCKAKKKIRQCDQSGRIIDIVYISDHNHDSSQQNISKALVASPAVDPLVEKQGDLEESVCLSATRQSSHQGSSSSIGNVGIRVVDRSASKPQSMQLSRSTGWGTQQHGICEVGSTEVSEENVHEASARVQDDEDSGTFLRVVKEPKIIVHATSDEEISSDGYRWRKYGQKMMKRNSLWRSYYRCTVDGCPIRKHVEKVTLDAENIIVTYQGRHNHDMSILKQHHVPESPPTPPSIVMNSNPRKRTKRTPSQPPLSKCSADMEIDTMREKILELGGDEALEIARILLSLGVERINSSYDSNPRKKLKRTSGQPPLSKC